MKTQGVLFLVAVLSILISCNNEVYHQGKGLYKQHCTNCHGEKGEGFRDLYPPLAKADYAIENVDKLACIIKYGLNETIQVNGKEYNQPMLGIQQLSSIEITNLVNYVNAEFLGNKEFLTLTNIENQLRACQEELLEEQ